MPTARGSTVSGESSNGRSTWTRSTRSTFAVVPIVVAIDESGIVHRERMIGNYA